MEFCPECGAKMVQKPLFTSFYSECEPCEVRARLAAQTTLEAVPMQEYPLDFDFDLAKEFERLVSRHNPGCDDCLTAISVGLDQCIGCGKTF